MFVVVSINFGKNNKKISDNLSYRGTLSNKRMLYNRVYPVFDIEFSILPLLDKGFYIDILDTDTMVVTRYNFVQFMKYFYYKNAAYPILPTTSRLINKNTLDEKKSSMRASYKNRLYYVVSDCGKFAASAIVAPKPVIFNSGIDIDIGSSDNVDYYTLDIHVYSKGYGCIESISYPYRLFSGIESDSICGSILNSFCIEQVDEETSVFKLLFKDDCDLGLQKVKGVEVSNKLCKYSTDAEVTLSTDLYDDFVDNLKYNNDLEEYVSKLIMG